MKELSHEQNREPILSNSKVTELVTSTLFYIYQSGKTPNLKDVIDNLHEVTNHDYETCSNVVDKMLSKQYLLPVEAPPGRDTYPEVAFGTNGLWLLENAFTHGEESIDSAALAERILTQSRFFD